jgi:formiminotetrahydrofolate cyclodeaminase
LSSFAPGGGSASVFAVAVGFAVAFERKPRTFS